MTKAVGILRYRSPRVEHADIVFVLADGRLMARAEDLYVEDGLSPSIDELPWAEDLVAPLTDLDHPRSFAAFIAQRRVTDDPIGDFVADARVDRRMPPAESWAELRSYLERRGADPAAVAAGRRTWHEFEAWRSGDE